MSDGTTNQETELLSIEDIEKAADIITKQEERALPKGLSWFTKLMNRFGWHRKYEIIIIDKSKFNNTFLSIRPKVEMIKLNSKQKKQ